MKHSCTFDSEYDDKTCVVLMNFRRRILSTQNHNSKTYFDYTLRVFVSISIAFGISRFAAVVLEFQQLICKKKKNRHTRKSKLKLYN